MATRFGPKDVRQKTTVPRAGKTSVPRRGRQKSALSQRTRGAERNVRAPYAPPEDWHEPVDTDRRDGGSVRRSYRIVAQAPGKGYRHVLAPHEIRQRLSEFPAAVTEALDVIQLSRMTRKKQSFPCYGLQWGTALYLYPIEEGLVEYFSRPPLPAQYNEALMYGGKWKQSGREWSLIWTEQAIKDFYLNNILIHELGHLLDDRNSSYIDRERYAEWFAIEHGYKQSDPRFEKSRQSRLKFRRRHHTG